jgi:DNA polymerase I
MEDIGVPVDRDAHTRLRENWNEIKTRIIQRVDADFGVYEEQSFRADKFAEYLDKQKIPWPRLPSGALALDDDTFKDMARAYPELAPLRELRISLSQLRLEDLAVGADGRNRCLLSAFRARTGRNQPSNAKFIFGPSVWIRGFIRPEPGTGIAYLDWSQQEFGIAGALSQDSNMMSAYTSGDPYLAFAKQAGAAPPSGTKEEYRDIREQFKAAVLAVQYSMGPESLGARIGRSVSEARELLRLHHETYRTFWKWSDAVVDYALLHGRLFTVFGWTVRIGPKVNPRMLRNFPMQANGAEMLRLACSLATERGVRVVAPVHDALLIEAPLEALEVAVETTRECMRKASEVVLAGFPLRSDAKVVRYPDRYQDPRGTRMWETVWATL